MVLDKNLVPSGADNFYADVNIPPDEILLFQRSEEQPMLNGGTFDLHTLIYTAPKGWSYVIPNGSETIWCQYIQIHDNGIPNVVSGVQEIDVMLDESYLIPLKQSLNGMLPFSSSDEEQEDDKFLKEIKEILSQ